mgnify:FL=1
MRDKTYKQEEILEFIKEALEEFNFIIESKYITKSEFTKFNKFFKNILRLSKKKKNPYFYPNYQGNTSNDEFYWTYPTFHTYEDSKCIGKIITLNIENVPNLDLKAIYRQFPLLIENHELLISLKPFIKLGKRPKDLEKDYEAERLKKASLENKATCGICSDYWELVDMGGEGQKFGLSKNVIADHGFTISRFGSGRNGVCFGARFESWEKSPKVKIEYVEQILKPILEEVKKEEPSEGTLLALTKSIERFKIALDKYYKLSFNERRDVEQPNRPEFMLSGQKVGLLLSTTRPTTLNELVEYWNNYKASIENEIIRFQTSIKNWTLQPTPRERLKQQ